MFANVSPGGVPLPGERRLSMGDAKDTKNDLPEVMRGRRQLHGDEKFCFDCRRDLACFTHCCADINILLTPVDVLQLSRKLGITTTDFLYHHTLKPITKELHLPVVMLRMNDEDKRCPFVGEGGCTVYEHRPWACRMYPVGMGLPPARAGQEPEPVYFLFEDDFCEGHKQQREWTIAQYRADQNVPAREEIEQGFQEIVSHPFFIGGTRQLSPQQIEMFYTAVYDLDSFRRFVFDSTFLHRFELEPELVEKMRADDAELLRFGFRWLHYALFREPTLTLRNEMPKAEKNP
jgi:uncharacterized protein